MHLFRPLLLMEDAAMEEFDGMDTKNPNAVVVGLAPSKFRYDLVGGRHENTMKWALCLGI